MIRFALASVCAALIVGCSSSDGEPGATPTEVTAACTVEDRCAGCTACFDECTCGGGDAAVCAEACRDTPPTEGDAGNVPPSAPVAPMVATLVMDTFEMEPGQEIFKCQNFENPFGQNAVVLSSESFMTAGSHHMFAFQVADEGDGELEDCSGLEFHGSIHGSQRSRERSSFPPGVGRLLTAWEGVRLQVHYLNSSSDRVRPEVAVTLQADTMEAVPTLASGIFINTISISVEPHSSGEAKQSCGVPKDVQLLSAGSHMHRRGVYFTARDDQGQLLYETTEWEEPDPWIFEPPRRLAAGSRIDVHCEYENESDQRLTFGESAATNEMCIFTGTYYPAEFAEGISCIF
jgi:hypothetical protein